ncbi:MAG: hypothetical protein ACLPND_02115 [Candidatus Korobacteraceae bacterium]
MSAPPAEVAGADFTIAIIPDPPLLAESCPDNLGRYYAALMKWIVENKKFVFTSSTPSFDANIKAVVGIGDCVNETGVNEERNAKTAWTILDKNRIAFTTPPGNHDYDSNRPSSRSNLGVQFATGYFSAKHRSSIYGSGIHLGDGDMAYWVGSHDTTGANTAVKFVISGIKLLILAMDFFARSRVRCAIYTRKSSEEGLEQSFNSLQAQREACEAYIASQRHEGWQVIAIAYGSVYPPPDIQVSRVPVPQN